MTDERKAFRAFVIGDDGERHEVTESVAVASGVDDLRAAMTVAMERLRAYVVRPKSGA